MGLGGGGAGGGEYLYLLFISIFFIFHRTQAMTKPFSDRQCKALHSTLLPRRNSTKTLYMTRLYHLDETAKQETENIPQARKIKSNS